MKILIISHNPVSDQSNMGKTFLSLLAGFEASQLCQLYIYPTVPNVPSCGSFFRVTDKDALGSRFHFGTVGGQILPERIGTVPGAFERPSDEPLYRNRKNKSPMRQLLRDGIWRMARWYTPALKQWLDRERPDCIFVAPGGAKFLYDIALRIADERKLSIVTYLCDEYYFVKAPRNPLGKYRLRLLKKKMEALLGRSSHLAVISPEMQAQYGPYFGLKTTVLLTGAAIAAAAPSKTCEDPQQICYFGNIRCGRYRSLARIAGELDSLNRQQGTHWKLRIYTAEKDPQILAQLRCHGSVELCPFAFGEDFAESLHNAQLLLHVEDFAAESVDKVRNSVSTKIADSLASGVPLVAYGPAGIASIEHLRRNECALLADDPAKLRQALLTAFTDADARRTAAQKGLHTAEKFHNTAAVSAKLGQILRNAAETRPMKVLQVNNFYGENSTGKLAQLLHEGLRNRGIQAITVYGRGQITCSPGVIRLCPEWYARANSLLSQITGLPYGGCLLSTGRLLRIVHKEKPDVVHLQCINGNFVNIYRLVRHLNRHGIPTVVSLHAEFMYTANCGHALDCDQWHQGCRRCPDPKQANRSKFLDRTGESWRKMHRAFRGFEENCIVCPVSKWTENRAKQSAILKSIPMKTVQNGVKTAIFGPKTGQKGAYIFHATAHFSDDPTNSKGGWYLLELAKRMPETAFLVAGPTEGIDDLPGNVTLLGNVTDQAVLAELYRNARLTVLTSRRETFSMPCAESLCCGTPVVGFRAGGPEEIALEGYSQFVPFGDLDALEGAVRKWLNSDADPGPAAVRAYDSAKMVEHFERIYRSFYETGTNRQRPAKNSISGCGADRGVSGSGAGPGCEPAVHMDLSVDTAAVAADCPQYIDL